MPDFPDRATLALLISILAVALTLWQSYSAHIAARLQKAASRRKSPSIEILGPEPQGQEPEGWQAWRIGIHNLEIVALRLTSITVRGKAAAIIGPRDIENWLRRPQPASAPPRETIYLFDQRLDGFGTTREFIDRVAYPDRTWLHIWTTGVTDQRQIHVNWQWADGQKS